MMEQQPDDAPSDMEAMQEVRAYVADMAEPTIEQFCFAHVDTTSEYRWRTVYKNELMATFTHRLQRRHSAYCGMAELAACRFGFLAQTPETVLQKRTTEEQLAWDEGPGSVSPRSRADGN
eukprot:5805790-Amphidinium_carterae.1